MIKSDGRDEPVGLRSGWRLSLAAEPKVHRSANGPHGQTSLSVAPKTRPIPERAQTSLSVAPSLNKQVCLPPVGKQQAVSVAPKADRILDEPQTILLGLSQRHQRNRNSIHELNGVAARCLKLQIASSPGYFGFDPFGHLL